MRSAQAPLVPGQRGRDINTYSGGHCARRPRERSSPPPGWAGRTIRGRDGKEVAEPAGKPGSVVDSHSSRRSVTATLKQPTRTRRGQRHGVPIWSCSRWGLPCRPVTRLAVRSYRTISPLPASAHLAMERTAGGIFLLHFPSARAAQALPGTVPCGARTFLGMLAHDATVWPAPPWAFYGFRRQMPPKVCCANLGPRLMSLPIPALPRAPLPRGLRAAGTWSRPALWA